MMSYPSVDGLVKMLDSKYALVTLVALRARELTELDAASDESHTEKKPVTKALEEICDGQITYKMKK